MQKDSLLFMNKPHPTVTLIISTYNRPDALSVSLSSVARLKLLPDQIVIGDDGSRDDTRKVVDDFKLASGIPLVHVWQEDKGFRLSMIRNKSLAAATGEYIIQIDGDEYLHPLFIHDHLAAAGKGYFVKGCRVKLTKEFSQKICAGKGKTIYYPGILSHGLEGERLKAMRIPPLSRWFAHNFKQRSYYALGGNMAFWREDLVAINGYDETFEGWGREDDDVAHRLGRYGLLKRDLRYAALCYHLWHCENSRDDLDDNDSYIKSQDRAQTTRCVNGLDKYL